MHRFRTYIAGIGSSGAILSAIAVAFLALGAIVSTDGLPIGSAESSDAAVEVDSSAPEAAAAAAALASLAPAADPAAAAPAAGAGGTRGGGPAAVGAPTGGGPGTAPGPTDFGPGNPPVTPPTDPPPPVAPAPTGDTAGLVGEVDETVRGATGVDLGLGQLAKPATDILDKTVQGLNGGRPLGLGEVDLPLGG